MKHYFQWAFLILCSILMVSCDSDDTATTSLPTPNGDVNLRGLAAGQQSRYVGFTGQCGFAGLDSFFYTGDTLICTIVDVDGVLHLEEQLSQGSASYDPHEAPALTAIYQEENRVRIPDRSASNLLFFYGSDYILTDPAHDVEVVQEGCTQMADGVPFVGDAIAKLETFEMHDIKLQDQTVVSCVPVIINLEAYLIYHDGLLNQSYWIDGGFPGVVLEGFTRL